MSWQAVQPRHALGLPANPESTDSEKTLTSNGVMNTGLLVELLQVLQKTKHGKRAVLCKMMDCFGMALGFLLVYTIRIQQKQKGRFFLAAWWAHTVKRQYVLWVWLCWDVGDLNFAMLCSVFSACVELALLLCSFWELSLACKVIRWGLHYEWCLLVAGASNVPCFQTICNDHEG